MDFETVTSLIGMVGLVGLVLAATYYATRFLGKHYSGQISLGKQIRIIDRLDLGRDRYLLVVHTAGKTLLVGVTPQNLNTLAELDDQDLEQQTSDSDSAGNMESFSHWLKKLRRFGGADGQNEQNGQNAEFPERHSNEVESKREDR